MTKAKVVSHNYTGLSLTVAIATDGRIETKIVDSSHPNWRQVDRLYRKGDFAAMIPLLDIAQAINTKFQGKFVVKNGKVYRGDEQVNGYLFDRILFFMREGLPFERLLKFAENLYANPSQRSREELFKFLDTKNEQNQRRGGFPITDDGCFLAYKGVQQDYYSITGGDAKVIKGEVKDRKILNKVGAKIEVARESVDDNANNGCSYGLHVGSWEYANGFKGNGRMLVVKVNPKDVVSVPHDCSYQKVRTCAYEVIAEEGRKLDELKNSNFDKAAKVRYHNRRDASGRFTKSK